MTKASTVKAKKPATTKLDLAQIRIDGGTQSRWQCDTAVVDEYAEAIEAGANFPPVTVFYDGANYWLADGFHRFAAHAKLGKAKIGVDIRQGTRREAVLHSVGANDTHGLRRSNSDKRCAICCLISDPEWSQWSDREIARHCRVGHPLVAKVRADMAPHLEEIPDSRKVERGGTTYTMDTSAIGKTPPPEHSGSAQTQVPAEPPAPVSTKEQVTAALPQAIKDAEAAKHKAKAARTSTSSPPTPEHGGLTPEQRIAELEESVRVLEEENAALKAENKLYGEMKVQFEQGGFAKVIADKDELLRVSETRVYGESQDKASWMKSAKYWQAEALKLGWSNTVEIDLETSEVVGG